MHGVKIQSVSRKLVDQTHLYILNNTVKVIPYILQHIDETKSTHSLHIDATHCIKRL